jgi:rubrerythrin
VVQKGDMHTPSGAATTHPRRSDFLRRTALVGGAAVAAGVVSGSPLITRAQPSRADLRALDLVLLVEYTEAAFYAEALERAGLQGELRGYAEEVAAQEREHLAFVKKALGGRAKPEPGFDFGDATRNGDSFAVAAAELEDLAVAAYNGQATNVSRDTLAAAATIVSVEARHAAWIRSIVGQPPAPDATDTPQSAEDVLAGLKRIGMRG